jgi:hypothetical protein
MNDYLLVLLECTVTRVLLSFLSVCTFDCSLFCFVTYICLQLYQEVLALPDVDNCRYYAQPCPCGSQEKRSKCCSEKFVLPYEEGKDTIDPRAIIWK